MRKLGKAAGTLLMVLAMVFTMVPMMAIAEDTPPAAVSDDDANFFDDVIIDDNNGEAGTGELPYVELPEEERDPNEDLSYMDFLADLGLLKGDENGDLLPYRSISRAEFTVIVLRLAGLQDEGFMEIAPTVQNFYDVPTDSWYYGPIKTACDLKMVVGYGDGYFKPEQPVSYNEAIKLILAAVNYSDIANAKGGYPYGYYVTASSMKMLDGTQMDKEDKTLRRTVGKMLFNALEITALNKAFDSKTQSVTYIPAGETIGKRLFNVEKKKGILDAVGNTAIDGVSDFEKTLTVSGMNFVTDRTDLEQYLGTSVTLYVREDGSSISAPEILYLSPDKKNTSITLDIEDIENVSEREVKYADEEDKIIKLKLNSNPSMLYNERSVLPFRYDLIKPTYTDPLTKKQNMPYNGTVTFIDNDGDEIYDIVNVSAYRVMMVGSVLTLRSQVKDYYAMKANLSDVMNFRESDNPDTEFEYVTDAGKEAKLSNMKEKSALNIYESVEADGINKKVKVVISNKVISGKVTAMDEDKVTIANNEYTVTKYYENAMEAFPDYAPQLKMGASVNVVVDGNKNIVGVTDSVSGSLGYLVEYGNGSDGYYAIIADKDGGIKTYPFHSKVSIDGSSYSDRDAERALEKTGKQNMPVTFKANGDGKLTSIEILELIRATGGIVSPSNKGEVLKFEYDGKSISMNIAETPILGIGFGAPGAEDRYPESGNCTVDPDKTMKLSADHVNAGGRGDKNYSNLNYLDVIYFVGLDTANAECDLVIMDTVNNTLTEDGVMPLPNEVRDLTTSYQNAWVNSQTPSGMADTTSDSMLCINKVITMQNEDGETIYQITGLQGGNEVKMSTAPDMIFTTGVVHESTVKHLKPMVQWTPSRGLKTDLLGDKYSFPARYQTTEQPEIKAGDIAYISMNSSGEISEFQYVANAADNPDRVVCANPKRASMVRGYCFEPFYGLDKDEIKSQQYDAHDGEGGAERKLKDGITTTLWDGENQKFIKGSREEIYGSNEKIQDIDDSAKLIDKNAEYNNCWLVMNKYNWECSEIIFIDYSLNAYAN